MIFTNECISVGGSIHPLMVPSETLKGPALTNPSVYFDRATGKLLVNIRNINYTLYHSEKKKYEHPWGPLVYIHPENDQHLRTWNILCELDEDMRIINYSHIDTTAFPNKELWEFVGLEDCRIVRWDDKLFCCGVRRDLDTVGTGRMELSEIEICDNFTVTEVNQIRMPIPNEGVKESYCEKNWMPIESMPYHFVKWTNGTEVVRYDPITNKTETVTLKEWRDGLNNADLRGGSQVIELNGYHVALEHETYLFKSPAGRKDGKYLHRFIVWDNSWNIVKVSQLFSFMGADVEFAVGLTEYKNDILMTFGFQDNAAYLLKVPKQNLINFIFNDSIV